MTGIVGPVQSGCEPITSTNGVRATTSSALVSVPTRYGQRRPAGARSAATKSTTQMTATTDVLPVTSAATARPRAARMPGPRSLRVSVAVAERRLVGCEPARGARPELELEARAGSG